MTTVQVQMIALSVVSWVGAVLIFMRPRHVRRLTAIVGLLCCAAAVPTCMRIPIAVPLVLVSAGVAVWMLVRDARSTTGEVE